MNSINGNVLSNNYFLDRRQKISSDKLKQTSHINRKKINNSHCSIKQLKSNPSDYLILFKMNPLRQTTINESLIKPLDAQEVKDVVKKLHKNGKYKELPFIKQLCQKNSGHIKDIEKAMDCAVDNLYGQMPTFYYPTKDYIEVESSYAHT